MRREHGATLLIVLVMLVVITLLAVAGMRMSNSSLQVVGNMQARKFAENVASQALEDVSAVLYLSDLLAPLLHGIHFDQDPVDTISHKLCNPAELRADDGHPRSEGL